MKRRDERWPAADIERLKDLFERRWPASTIALLMGRSRNAIIGKWTRLGLRRRLDQGPYRERALVPVAREVEAKPTPPEKPVPPPKPVKLKQTKKAERMPRLKRSKPDAARAVDVLGLYRMVGMYNIKPEILGQVCELMRLHPEGCRWAIGANGDGHVFCNRQRAEGSAYCAEHAALGVTAGWVKRYG
jgi:hypothetical protein